MRAVARSTLACGEHSAAADPLEVFNRCLPILVLATSRSPEWHHSAATDSVPDCRYKAGPVTPYILRKHLSSAVCSAATSFIAARP